MLVGLHTATIEIRTAAGGGGDLLASRKHGFYLTSGETENAGTIHMGVAISGGLCDPAKIDIPEGTTLFFENRDATARTVTAGRTAPYNEVATDEIAAVTTGDETTGDTYNADSLTFASAGSYIYQTGGGGNDTDAYRILVYAVPTITSVTNAAGYDFDNETDTSTVNFVIKGTNFGDDRAMVNGMVRFQSDKAGSTPVYVDNANFATWTDTQITGSIDLPGIESGYHYVVDVIVRGTVANAPNNFYKGASCPVPSVTSIKDNNGAGDNYSVDDNQETVTFVIAGTNFSSSQTMVGGTVTFVDVNPPGATTDYAATVTAWADTQITGTIVLPKSTGGTGALNPGGGKYRIKINARGSDNTEKVYYYKGTGNYTVIVD